MSETLITFLASYLIWVMVGSLVVWWVVDGLKDREMIAAAVIAGTVAWLVAFLVKDLVNEPRPFMVNGGEVLTATLHEDGSFPSGHAALIFALATVVWMRSRKWGVVYMVLAVVVGIGRVWANVHYPIDIAGGAVIGMGVGWLVSRFSLKKLVKKVS